MGKFSFLDDFWMTFSQLVDAVQDPVVAALSGIVRTSVPPLLDEALNGISLVQRFHCQRRSTRPTVLTLHRQTQVMLGPLGAGYIELALELSGLQCE